MRARVEMTKPSGVELLKQNSPMLVGTIPQTLADSQMDHFSEDDSQFLKFHGVYQQNDRDRRETGEKWIFLGRGRLPGGVLTPAQYLTLDRLAAQFVNPALRITSRQGLQFHGVLKHDLARTIKGINEALLTTLAGAGDLARNVLAPSLPLADAVMRQVQEQARRISDLLRPTTPAYHQIWIEGTKLEFNRAEDQQFADPLYGQTYLPRKFKVAFAIPPRNDVDLFTNCLGFIAITENGRLRGYNLTAGGGMGRSHGNPQTFPRVAEVVGFVRPDQVEAATRAVVTLHRDFGDRSNRKQARLKYVLTERGVDWFRAEVGRRLGAPLGSARPFAFTSQGDRFGWHEQGDGGLFLGLFVETGRIRDTETRQLKTALRKVVEQLQPEIHITPANNLMLANIAPAQRAAITALLAEHGVAVESQGSVVRRASMACVALPTCGLALAESERYLPGLMTRLEDLMAEVGLAGEEIILRMTGCPNGCARPYMAEIGLVGRAPGRYQIYLGGNVAGTRLNRLHKDNIRDADILSELRPLLIRYARERAEGERFGDWSERALLASSNAR
jgi:sulfite reductase (NADPH) hemoprotein beta-component